MEKIQFPLKYKSLFRKDEKASGHGVEENVVEKLEATQVLVKMAYAPINPADLMFFLNNNYADPSKCPKGRVVGGFEGSGVVEAVGSEVSGDLVGSKVAFCIHPYTPDFHGTWSEYVVVQEKTLFVFPKEAELSKIHSPLINPATAYAMLEVLKQDGAKSVLLNAAGSQLCRILIRLCKREGINVLGTVRRDEQIELLKGYGAHTIINCKKETYEADLAKAIGELQPHHFFDAVGGDAAILVYKALPNDSTLYNYGALSMQPFNGITAFDTIFHRKVLRLSFYF